MGGSPQLHLAMWTAVFTVIGLYKLAEGVNNWLTGRRQRPWATRCLAALHIYQR